MGERHNPAIDLGPTTTMTDLGMHLIGEIEHGGTLLKVNDFALRGQRIHALFNQLAVDPGQR